jgi:hypothetical protein
MNDRASLNGMPTSLDASASGHLPLRNKSSLSLKKGAPWFRLHARSTLGQQASQWYQRRNFAPSVTHLMKQSTWSSLHTPPHPVPSSGQACPPSPSPASSAMTRLSPRLLLHEQHKLQPTWAPGSYVLLEIATRANSRRPLRAVVAVT